MTIRLVTILCCFLLLAQACTTSSEAPPRDTPYDRTEEREDCNSYDANRQPFFGEQHVHTSFSYDAIIMENKINGPAEAYAFAKGESVFLPESFENVEPVREIQLERPLDWAIVTDHSEWLGATFICNHDDSATGVDSEDCQLQRKDSRKSQLIWSRKIRSSFVTARSTAIGYLRRRRRPARRTRWWPSPVRSWAGP